MKSTDAKRWPAKCSELCNDPFFQLVLTCVQAYAHPGFIFNSFDDPCQLFKLAAQHVSRPCLKMIHAVESLMKRQSWPQYHVLDDGDNVFRCLVSTVEQGRDMGH
jgi:hypothetical protein